MFHQILESDAFRPGHNLLAGDPGAADYRRMNELQFPENCGHTILSRRAFCELGAAISAGVLLNAETFAAATPQRCVVAWSEGTAPKDVYPNDINGAIAEGLKSLRGWKVVTANLTDPDQGISDERFKQTDVVFDGVYSRPVGTKEPSRQGLCWTVGKGMVFYFQPGHETFPDLARPEVRRIFRNAVRWAAPKRQPA